MKLASIILGERTELGIRCDDGILPISALQRRTHRVLPSNIQDVVVSRKELEKIEVALEEHLSDVGSDLLNEADVRFAPCVPSTTRIFCIGLNYRRHAEETNATIPSTPVLFSKFSNSLSAHREDIPIPGLAEQMDYEAELAIVMGRHAYQIEKEDALSYVFGYCNANDISSRDLQLRTGQWILGKTLDKFAPMGPYLVTAEDVLNPNRLAIKTYRNGTIVQDSNTADMIFYCDDLIHYLSQYIALEPGDVILTGTPEGVILGLPEQERVWLKDSDEIVVEIEGLGKLSNRFVRLP